MDSIGKRLRELREARGLSQAEVAARVKLRYPRARITQQNLAQLEASPTRRSSYLPEIADVLDANVDWLALGLGLRDRSAERAALSDPKISAAMKVMQPMSEYRKSQALKILDTIAEPPSGSSGEPQKVGNG